MTSDKPIHNPVHNFILTELNISYISLVYQNSFCTFYLVTPYIDCVDHNKLENPERDGNTRLPDLPLKKSVCRSGSNS